MTNTGGSVHIIEPGTLCVSQKPKVLRCEVLKESTIRWVMSPDLRFQKNSKEGFFFYPHPMFVMLLCYCIMK